jgi:hypothetical protein
MKPTTKKRLQLEKHTLRMLVEDDLAKAQGGDSSTCQSGATTLNATCVGCA